MLAVIALWLFTKTNPDIGRTPQKKKRDLIYRTCGIVIALCLVLVPIESLVIGAPIQRFRPLFWLEAVAVVAFGIAWLVKGETILKDKSQPSGGEDAKLPPGSEPVGELAGSSR